MKGRYSGISYSIIILLLFGCQNRTISEEYIIEENKLIFIQYYPDGSLMSKIEASKDSIPNGKAENYYQSGKLKTERFYKKGIRDSIETEYYESGVLKRISLISSGKRWGETLIYFEDVIEEYVDVIKGDTMVIEQPLLDKYIFYNHQGNIAFERDYDDTGKIDFESGNSICFYHVPDISVKANELFSIRFYLAIPKWNEHDFRIKLFDPNGKLLENKIWQVDTKYNAVFYERVFDKDGMYKIIASTTMLDEVLGSQKEDSIIVEIPIGNTERSRQI